MNKSRVKTFVSVLAITALIVGISACDEIVAILSGGEVLQMDDMDGEIPIGVVLPQTGVLGPSEFGPGALVMENAFKMALEEVNNSKSMGTQLEFIIEDDRSTVEGAVEAFNKLIHEDQVPVILGVWTSEVAQSVFPIAQENQVVAFSPVVLGGGLTEIGDFAFRAAQPTDVLIPEGVRVTREKLGYQQVATIADSADFASRNSDKVFRQSLTDYGVKILETEIFETGETNFLPQLNRIKTSNPDAIFVSAQQIELIKILTQARQLGIPFDVPFINLVLSADDIGSTGEAAEGTITIASWVSTADTPGNQAFVKNYTSKYGLQPSIWAALSYASVHILAEAIANAESTDSVAIRDALAGISDFDTVLGKFAFDEVGDGDYAPIVLVVKDGKFEIFGDDDTVDSTTHIIDDLPIQSVSVLILESFPLQVHLEVEGYLADSCTALHETTKRREGDTIHVQITTKRPQDLACATVITEIQHTVPLGFFDPGSYQAIVNGTIVEFEVQ